VSGRSPWIYDFDGDSDDAGVFVTVIPAGCP
jgi:hypothetical protein